MNQEDPSPPPGSSWDPGVAVEPKDGRDTVERLLAAGEDLYGKHGLYGVPLRQIVVAAGCSNKYAVQYHFGDASGLAQAILTRRLAAIDQRRGRLLAELEASGRTADVRTLAHILLTPVFEQRSGQGERSFARFMVALLNSPRGVQYFVDAFAFRPSEGQLLRLLGEAVPDLPFALLVERLRLLTIMALSGAFNRLTSFGLNADQDLIEDSIDMVAAALAVRPDERMWALGRAASL